VDKASLQINFERNSLNCTYIFLLNVNFENPTVKLHVLYIFHVYVKFRSNQILFTIRLMNLFFMHYFLSQEIEIEIFD